MPAREEAAHIALVDDDAFFRESLGENLVASGYEVAAFDGGGPLLAALADGTKPDLVILDWKMPEMNGIEVLKRLRETGFEVPVIFLTVLDDQIYEETALHGGAVDYIEKSRSFSILLRRIELILGGARSERPAQGSEEDGEDGKEPIRYGHLELLPDVARARWRNQEVDLTLTEFKIIHHLASQPGRDCRYRELYDLARGENFMAGSGPEGYRTNVRTFVKRIRQKFRSLDESFDEIENYPGFGYRWRASGSGEGPDG